MQGGNVQPIGGEYKKVDNYVFNPHQGLLGKGAFAAVYKAYDESKNHKEIAVKVVSAAKLLENEDQYSLFMREIEVLRQIKGENIVHLLDVKRTPNNLYIFTDYCNGGDLEKYIKKNGPLSEDEALKILKQITNAFIDLDNLVFKNSQGHKVSIMHRDIKPPNILFNDGEIRIADFGFAKIVDDNVKNIKMRHTLLGTPLYMNPQTLADEAYSFKCDIWSTGVVFYECLFGKLPWTGNSINNLLGNIKKLPLEFSKTISDDTKDLLRKMLQIREETRIDWYGIRDHKAFKKIRLSNEISKEPELIKIPAKYDNITSPTLSTDTSKKNSLDKIPVKYDNIISPTLATDASKKNNLEVIKIIPQIEEKNERNPISMIPPKYDLKPNTYLETKDPKSSPNSYGGSNQNRPKTPTSNPYTGYIQKK